MNTLFNVTRACGFAAAGLALTLAPAAVAQTTNGVNNGDFGDAATWDNGVPGNGDRFFIRTFATNPITVTLDSPSDLPALPYAFGQSSIGGNDGGLATLIQTDGDLILADELRLGDDFGLTSGTSGEYTISGGSLDVSTSNIRLDGGVNSTFAIVGSGPTSVVTDRFIMNSGSTLDFTIDATGVTPLTIEIRAGFDGLLDVDFDGFTPAIGTTFQLVDGNPNGTSFAGFDATADSLAGPDSVLLSLSIIDDGTANEGVFVTVVPEPATLSLLAAAGLLIGRRRK